MAFKRVGQKDDEGTFTWDEPEDGYWWHYAGPEGVEAANTDPKQFGKVLRSEEPLPPALSGKRLIRVAPSKKFVSQWEKAAPGGQILKVDPKRLQSNEFHRVQRNGNVVVLGEAAVRAGAFQPLK